MASHRPEWNHNIHYQAAVLRMVPPGAVRALDVGCGDGGLARRMRGSVGRVTAIDVDEPMVRLAAAHPDGGGVEYVLGDFLAHPFAPESFDVVGCIAALHHMDEAAALARMRDLLRPGGALAVVGLYRHRPADVPWDAAGAVATRLHRLTRSYRETPAPKLWPPPRTYGEVRALAARLLPGSRMRHGVMWRYILTWRKPG